MDKKSCERIDEFFKKYTNGKIVKHLIEIEIGYKRWQYITREEWIKGYIPRVDRAIWNPHFDTSTGQMIESYSKVRELEKSGLMYMTIREHETLMKKERVEKKKKTNQRINKNLHKKLIELKQGKSFVKELLNQIYGKQ